MRTFVIKLQESLREVLFKGFKFLQEFPGDDFNSLGVREKNVKSLR